MPETTLVLGASLNPSRYSNFVIKRLLAASYKVVAVGGREGEVEGIPVLTGKPGFEDIHTVTLYLNPLRQQEFYEYIVSLKPRRVIFNPGTENPEFYQILREHHIDVEIACTLVLLSTNQY